MFCVVSKKFLTNSQQAPKNGKNSVKHQQYNLFHISMQIKSKGSIKPLASLLSKEQPYISF